MHGLAGKFRCWAGVLGWVALLGGLLGCATTPKVDWAGRIGHFSFDQAVLELGPPDKSAKLNDATLVAEWLTHRGYSHATVQTYPGMWVHSYTEAPAPDRFLRLTFGPDGQLREWKRIIK